jgi:hypothetical protein
LAAEGRNSPSIADLALIEEACGTNGVGILSRKFELVDSADTQQTMNFDEVSY